MHMTDELRQSLQRFTDESAHVLPTQEGREFAAMIVGTVNRLVEAMASGRTADAKMETLTFSRQLSDTYVEVPPSLTRVAEAVAQIRRCLA
jgi:hypothetical protein